MFSVVRVPQVWCHPVAMPVAPLVWETTLCLVDALLHPRAFVIHDMCEEEQQASLGRGRSPPALLRRRAAPASATREHYPSLTRGAGPLACLGVGSARVHILKTALTRAPTRESNSSAFPRQKAKRIYNTSSVCNTRTPSPL